MVLKNSDILASINGDFLDMHVTHGISSKYPPNHHRCWLLKKDAAGHFNELTEGGSFSGFGSEIFLSWKGFNMCRSTDH